MAFEDGEAPETQRPASFLGRFSRTAVIYGLLAISLVHAFFDIRLSQARLPGSERPE